MNIIDIAPISPEYLPPSSGSTEQHSLRKRHQIMEWQGCDLPADEYGFEIRGNKLRARLTNQAPAPNELLKSFFCNCKSDCNDKRCSCQKYSLKCTDLCGNVVNVPITNY